jgi:hypothetical protein
MDVFGKIGPRPWFDYANDDEGWPLVSEDVTFCQKAAAAGFGIWMDPTVKCGHSTIYTVTEKWFKSIVTEQSGVTVQTSERVIPPPSDHWDVAGVVAAG